MEDLHKQKAINPMPGNFVIGLAISSSLVWPVSLYFFSLAISIPISLTLGIMVGCFTAWYLEEQ